MVDSKKVIKKRSLSMTVIITIACIFIGIVISVQFNTIAANKQMDDEKNKTLEELQMQLIREMNSNGLLESDINALNEKIKSLEDNLIGRQEDILKEEYRKAQLLAGLTNVTGPGLEIMIGMNANMLMDPSDVMTIINDLRMGRAQAISINDERIVSMTDITEGSNFLVVNGVPITAPYTIKAIGDAEKLHTIITTPGGRLDYLEASGDWPIKIEQKTEVAIPKIKEGSLAINTDLISDVVS